ncbi:hypothetical protein EDB82DRAFT_494759 [Fusarium venenatum]|uniref:uncharacterized protein n=1 Tax=Fusarium venenatum TaxID=56646 RepID=UPI001D3F4AF3|nr:hypothetical protein EDB82DRAFT_494759 [Fusarium venenatum]
MKLKGILHALLVLGASGVVLTDTTHDSSGLYDLELHDGNDATIQKNYKGWVNPEDLPPMPQCIAQQDQTGWLSAMTKCTRHRCTHWFIFCTHYQWLTELSCLRNEFSPSTIQRYISYCSRSVLAEAQLAEWIQHITGRNWLVHLGDTNGLQSLSPRSLTQGFKTVSVEEKAPTCLKKSTSQINEPFEHVMASCGFTSTTLHEGNADRPWEYSTARKSMTALGFDTAGYDLTNSHIPLGEYFDKECFCNYFSIDPKHEPCSDQLDLAKERLWLHAICGSSQLPVNWKKSLKVVGENYIPTYRWASSSDLPDLPQSIPELSEQCRTEACNTDPEGFCQVESAIDRTCVCGKLDYSLCQGPCQNFESRKKYVWWLVDLCDDFEDWHGLPNDWHELLAPRPRDMIPWRWILRPESDRDINCPSYAANLSSLAFVNIAIALAVYFGERFSRNVKAPESPPQSPAWVLRGLVLASVQAAGHWIAINTIQSTPGYESVPTLQLILLLCTMPRLGWLAIAPKEIHCSESKDLTAACSALYAEGFLQIPNLYSMTTVLNYGFRNGFYFGVLPYTELGYSAWMMYGGALLWLVAVALIVVIVIRILRPVFATHTLIYTVSEDLSKCDGNKCTSTNERDETGHLLINPEYSGLGERLRYGTIPEVAGPSQPPNSLREPHLSLYVVLTAGFPVIFLAQCLFWIGFVRVSGAK